MCNKSDKEKNRLMTTKENKAMTTVAVTSGMNGGSGGTMKKICKQREKKTMAVWTSSGKRRQLRFKKLSKGHFCHFTKFVGCTNNCVGPQSNTYSSLDWSCWWSDFIFLLVLYKLFLNNWFRIHVIFFMLIMLLVWNIHWFYWWLIFVGKPS